MDYTNLQNLSLVSNKRGRSSGDNINQEMSFRRKERGKRYEPKILLDLFNGPLKKKSDSLYKSYPSLTKLFPQYVEIFRYVIIRELENTTFEPVIVENFDGPFEINWSKEIRREYDTSMISGNLSTSLKDGNLHGLYFLTISDNTIHDQDSYDTTDLYIITEFQDGVIGKRLLYIKYNYDKLFVLLYRDGTLVLWNMKDEEVITDLF